MPWKNGPEFWQFILGLVAMTLAAAVGAITKIAEDVKSGNRASFWSRKLWLDVPAVGMMGLVGIGIAEYLELTRGGSIALGASLGWAGPRTVDAIIDSRLRGLEKRK